MCVCGWRGGCTETQDYGVTGVSYSADVKVASWPLGIHDYKFSVSIWHQNSNLGLSSGLVSCQEGQTEESQVVQ